MNRIVFGCHATLSNIWHVFFNWPTTPLPRSDWLPISTQTRNFWCLYDSMLAEAVQMISVMLMNVGRMPRGPLKIIWNRTDWPVFQNGQKQTRGAPFAAATLRSFGAGLIRCRHCGVSCTIHLGMTSVRSCWRKFSRISCAGANVQIVDTLALRAMGRHGWLHGWLTRCQQIWLVYGPVYESCGCA